jgi:hypothetical protein
MKFLPARPAIVRRLLQNDIPSFATSKHAEGTLSVACGQCRTHSRSIYTRQYKRAEYALLKNSHGSAETRRTVVLPAAFIAGQRRSLNTVQNGRIPSMAHVQCLRFSIVNKDNYGPIQEYDARVKSGRLRDDEHQRGGVRPKESNISC